RRAPALVALAPLLIAAADAEERDQPAGVGLVALPAVARLRGHAGHVLLDHQLVVEVDALGDLGEREAALRVDEAEGRAGEGRERILHAAAHGHVGAASAAAHIRAAARGEISASAAALGHVLRAATSAVAVVEITGAAGGGPGSQSERESDEARPKRGAS